MPQARHILYLKGTKQQVRVNNKFIRPSSPLPPKKEEILGTPLFRMCGPPLPGVSCVQSVSQSVGSPDAGARSSTDRRHCVSVVVVVSRTRRRAFDVGHVVRRAFLTVVLPRRRRRYDQVQHAVTALHPRSPDQRPAARRRRSHERRPQQRRRGGGGNDVIGRGRGRK